MLTWVWSGTAQRRVLSLARHLGGIYPDMTRVVLTSGRGSRASTISDLLRNQILLVVTTCGEQRRVMAFLSGLLQKEYQGRRTDGSVVLSQVSLRVIT